MQSAQKRTWSCLHETMAAFVADYRANALTEMSKANRGAWREPMRQGKESESRCMAERNIHADQYVKSKDPPRHRNSGGA